MENMPSSGLLFFTSPRFKNLGEGTKKETYFERSKRKRTEFALLDNSFKRISRKTSGFDHNGRSDHAGRHKRNRKEAR